MDWYCAEILQVLTDRIKISWYTTQEAPLQNHQGATLRARQQNLALAKFKRTWIMRPSGLPTTIEPVTTRQRNLLYTGRIPNGELDDHLLVRDVILTRTGRLSPETLIIAAALTRPHHQFAA